MSARNKPSKPQKPQKPQIVAVKSRAATAQPNARAQAQANSTPAARAIAAAMAKAQAVKDAKAAEAKAKQKAEQKVQAAAKAEADKKQQTSPAEKKSQGKKRSHKKAFKRFDGEAFFKIRGRLSPPPADILESEDATVGGKNRMWLLTKDGDRFRVEGYRNDIVHFLLLQPDNYIGPMLTFVGNAGRAGRIFIEKITTDPAYKPADGAIQLGEMRCKGQIQRIEDDRSRAWVKVSGVTSASYKNFASIDIKHFPEDAKSGALVDWRCARKDGAWAVIGDYVPIAAHPPKPKKEKEATAEETKNTDK